MTEAGEHVVGFDRPTARSSKDGAKSDGLDAVRAARELLTRDTWAQPRSRGDREAIRTLLSCRNSAQHARTAAINELKALVTTCHPSLREQLRHLSAERLVKRCHALDTSGQHSETAGTTLAMRCLARRISTLAAETHEIDVELTDLINTVAPQLLVEYGIGTVIAAQIIVSWSHTGRCHSEAAFARLAGVAPVEATSGQVQTRHRLNRGGDRALNRALHLTIVTRTGRHQPTRDYIPRRISEGKTPREARRCLKRYLARHIYRILENPPT